MTCSTLIVKILLPNWLTADYVKTDAVAAVKKFHICQIQVTLNYHGEVLFLDIRNWS